jgi:hypothetical protein
MIRAALQTFPFSHQPELVFTVTLANRASVLMKLGTSLEDDSIFKVVIVDAKKFVKAWRADPYGHQTEIAHGNPTTWMVDRKFADAELAFLKNQTSPVPLALVSAFWALRTVRWPRHFNPFQWRSAPGCLNFTDGITRTIWLLSNGCAAFPVLCKHGQGECLARVAGVGQAKAYSPLELFKEAQLSSLEWNTAISSSLRSV